MKNQQLLVDFINTEHNGNIRECSLKYSIDYSSLYKYFHGTLTLGLKAAKNIEDKIYAKTNKRIFSGKIQDNSSISSSIVSSFNNDVANNYAVDTKILTKNGWKSENLRVISMPDEGMEPIIDEHALLIIDVSQTEPESGKIYAVQFGNDILIRRVIKEAGSNQYIAKPATFAFIEQNFTKETAKILGRVIYRMGELL